MGNADMELRIASLEKENLILRKLLERSKKSRAMLEETVSSQLELLKVRNDELQKYQEEIRRSEARFKELAHHDPLTGLANRILFQEQLTKAMMRAKREQRSIALLFIDLDNFKIVNDTAGHDAGDAVLQETGHRLLDCVRGYDTVCRIGGDEYVALLEQLPERVVVESVAERIVAKMSKPFVYQEHCFSVSASIGISMYPMDGDNMEELMHKADSAMYRVKRSGRNGWGRFRRVTAASVLLHSITGKIRESGVYRRTGIILQ